MRQLCPLVTDQPGAHEAAVTATFNADTPFVYAERIVVDDFFGQLATVMDITVADLTKQTVHEVLAKAERSAVINNEDFVALQDEHQLLEVIAVACGADERPTVDDCN